MAAIATRYVRIAVEPGFAARFRDAGNDAGHEFARAFRLRVTASLAGFNPKVKVQLDWDNFRPPPLPPINLRVGFDMTSAIQAGRRAAMVATAAAGPIILDVQTRGGGGGFFNFAQSQIQNLIVNFGHMSQVINNASSSANSFGSSLMDLGGPIGQALGVAKVAAIISLLPAAVWTAIGAIYALGGALGSIPALSVGLGASVGVLKLGFMGLAEHLQGTAKGGGGAAKSMSGVHNAMRALTRAQRDLTKATKEIDKARAGEIERIDDLGRAMRGAYLDEEDAVAAVAEARTKLAEARASEDPNAIGEAERAYKRSLLTLDEARDKVGDLSEDKAKADKDGVEGSDAMQQAYERQRDAVESVAAAEEALAEARKSQGGGGAAQQLMKLAPAAQEVVDKLKQLKPVFEEIRLAVQQNLFQGVAPELQKLSDAWKRPLKDTLVSYASTFNGMFKDLSASVRNPEFIANITSGAETVRSNMEKVGKQITGPFVEAFGILARAAKPFIDTLGDKIAGLVEHFSDWIKSADSSGDLAKFFEDAAFYLDQIWTIGGNVVGLLGDIFDIIFESESQGGAGDFLGSLNDKLVMLREWLADPENKKRLIELVDKIGEFAKNAAEVTNWIVEKGLPALSSLWTKFEEGKDKVDAVKKKLDEFVDRWKRLRDTILAPLNFGGMFDGLSNAFKSSVNRIINGWNSIRFTIPGFSFFGANWPSFTIDPPWIQPLAKGGVARATPGGITAQIAEGGKDEAVAPVDVLMGYIRTAVAEAGGGGDITIPIYLGMELIDTIIISAAQRQKAKLAKIVNGGNKSLGYAS